MRYAAASLVAISLAALLTGTPANGAPPPQADATPSTSESTLSVQLARRIEVAFRQHASLIGAVAVTVGARTPSEFPGYDHIQITYASEGQPPVSLPFLVSADGNKLIQLREFDVAADPRALVSADDGPARGGPSTAPVLIVGFDDLECPFCAQLNATLFPAILDRYRDRVRVVYRDYPSDEHPWAKRAAIDTGCLAAQSAPAYWQAVDTIHLQAGTIGGPHYTLQNASHTLDHIAREVGEFNRLDAKALNECVETQNASSVDRSIHEGNNLGIQATPTLFINGAKITGTVPLDFMYRMIDQALIAEGQTPPPGPAKKQSAAH